MFGEQIALHHLELIELIGRSLSSQYTSLDNLDDGERHTGDIGTSSDNLTPITESLSCWTKDEMLLYVWEAWKRDRWSGVRIAFRGTDMDDVFVCSCLSTVTNIPRVFYSLLSLNGDFYE